MIFDPTLLLVIGAATAGGAVASHLPSMMSWLASKARSGESAVKTAAASVENAIAHPLTTVQTAEHAMALKVADDAGRLIAYLTDKTPEQAKQQAINAVVEAKNKALDDLIARLQAARQQ